MFHFRIVLVLSTFIALFDGVSSQLHSGRAQLMKDALGWMTLRNNSELMTDAELDQAFLTHVTDKYRNNSFYRTFVIAFMEAVVPRLTLKENELCDPAYTLKYKDSVSNSVTYGHQRLFTFDVFDNRKRNRDKYCDYREGLICHPTARKCTCPEGSTMQPIDRSSSVKRCLLQENEICSLLDLSHEKDYSILKDNLYHLIFNLEKPPGCKMGTQCRFKPSDLTTPLCYDANSGPWAPPYTDSGGNTVNEWRIDYGEECTLGLYANSGSCITLPRNRTIGVFFSSVCFNFGPPRSTSGGSNRTGFCVNKFGPYGISSSLDIGNLLKDFYTFFFPYIHPRTIPLRGQELEDFYRRCLTASWRIHPRYKDPATNKIYDIQVHYEGGSCSVRKTKEYEDFWKYFIGLTKNPPPGQDYVPEATKAQLNSKLQKFVDLTNYTAWPGRICKVYHHFEKPLSVPPSPIASYPSLKCVKNETSEGIGNDGRCQAPGNLAKETIPEAQKFIDFLVADEKVERNLKWNLRKDILRVFREHMDRQCFEQSPVCPANYTCFEDYSDLRDIYERWTCEFKNSTQELDLFCHNSRPDLKYRKCEEKQLNRRAFEEFERMGEYSKIGIGDSCDYDLQKSTRQWIKDGRAPDGINRYVLLAKLKDLEKSAKEGRGGGICDFSRLQECGENNVCQCLTIRSVRFVPRNVTIAGVVYQSDYCYQPSECGISIHKILVTKSEEKKLRQHYGDGDKCDGENLCVYFDKKTGKCADKNTGNTGYEAPKVEPTPPPPVEPGSEGSSDLHSGYGFAGGCEYFGGNKLLNKGLILAFGLIAFIPREI